MAIHSLHLSIATFLLWLLWCSADLLHKQTVVVFRAWMEVGLVQLAAWLGQWVGETLLSEGCGMICRHQHHTEHGSFSLSSSGQNKVAGLWWFSSLLQSGPLSVDTSHKVWNLLFNCLVVRNIYFELRLDILYHLLSDRYKQIIQVLLNHF